MTAHPLFRSTRPWLGAAAFAALAGAGSMAQAAEYATVVSSTPVMGSVSVPSRECAEGQQIVQRQPSGAGALIGAVAGGVLGNQIGHGFGRAAATGLGAITGSVVGNNVEANNSSAVAVPVRNCRTVSTLENRVVGYDVAYEYNGQRYTTRLANDPGQRLAIDVRPQAAAAGSALDRVGPSTAYASPRYVEAAPEYVQAQPTYGYYEQGPTYYAPSPVYYAPSAAYVAPFIGFGLGYWGGYGYGRYHGGYHGGYRGYRH